ncbi:MAG: hypothetical protein ACLR4Z_12680 [Butyricicoccaceae bacterium]
MLGVEVAAWRASATSLTPATGAPQRSRQGRIRGPIPGLQRAAMRVAGGPKGLRIRLARPSWLLRQARAFDAIHIGRSVVAPGRRRRGRLSSARFHPSPEEDHRPHPGLHERPRNRREQGTRVRLLRLGLPERLHRLPHVRKDLQVRRRDPRCRRR